MRSAFPVILAVAVVSGVVAHSKTRAVPGQEQSASRPRLDVAFVLDTTGSMSDEIVVVKEKLVAIAQEVRAGHPAPDVRFALVAYRDKGDAYVTKSFDFDRDVEHLQANIRGLTAAGGGDEPEDIASALHAALELSWDPSPSVARMAFLVGDAGPQAYPGQPTWQQAVATFKDRKISIDTIGCSGLSTSAQSSFRSIAERTGGRFDFLTYEKVARLANGQTKTLLSSGSVVYEAKEELSESDWKRGTAVLEKEGKIAPASPAAFAAGGPGVSAPSGIFRGTNNLDREISTRLLDTATANGSAYGR